MTLQWTLVAYFLYAEIGLVSMLMLPFISVTHWKKLFDLDLVKKISLHANKYFRMSNLQTNATGVASNVNLTDEDEIARYNFNLSHILL